MATQTVKIRFNGKSGGLQIETKGFFGDACTEVTREILSGTGASIVFETKTPEADLEPPTQSQNGAQELLA